MKTSSKRIMFVLIAVGVLLCAVGVYSLLVQPEYQAIATLRGALASKVDAVGTYNATIQKVNNLSSALGGSNAQQEQASKILPLNPDVSYVSAQILGIAQQNGVVIDMLSVQPGALLSSQSVAIKSVGQLRADVHFSGGYASIKNFLQGVENNMLLMNVVNISASVPAQTSATAPAGAMSGTLSIVSYYQTTQ